MQRNTSVAALRLAVEKAGSLAKLAAICQCSKQNIHLALQTGRGLPAKHVTVVAEALKIPAHILRPDLYPEPADGAGYPQGDVNARG